MTTQVNFDSIGGGGSKAASGYITDWTSGDKKVEIGFEPKSIAWFSPTSTYHTAYFYDADTNATKFYGVQGTTSLWHGVAVGGNLYWNGLKSVDADGFTLEKYDAGYGSGNIFFIAIG